MFYSGASLATSLVPSRARLHVTHRRTTPSLPAHSRGFAQPFSAAVPVVAPPPPPPHLIDPGAPCRGQQRAPRTRFWAMTQQPAVALSAHPQQSLRPGETNEISLIFNLQCRGREGGSRAKHATPSHLERVWLEAMVNRSGLGVEIESGAPGIKVSGMRFGQSKN